MTALPAADRMRALLRRAGAKAIHQVHWTLADERERRVIAWAREGQDTRKRLDYPLDATSVVVDLGGFEGQWASDIVARFGCEVHVFEPVGRFADHIAWRFAHNDRVTVHRVGLASRDGEAVFRLSGPGTSMFAEASGAAQGDAVPVRFAEAVGYLEQQGISRIDLLKLNIEGGEFDLLEHLVDQGRLASVGHLQVQFHDVVPAAAARREAIRARLAVSHELAWDEPWLWESWSRLAPPAPRDGGPA